MGFFLSFTGGAEGAPPPPLPYTSSLYLRLAEFWVNRSQGGPRLSPPLVAGPCAQGFRLLTVSDTLGPGALSAVNPKRGVRARMGCWCCGVARAWPPAR